MGDSRNAGPGEDVHLDVTHRPEYEIALLAQELKPVLPALGVTRLLFRHTYLRVTIKVGSAENVIYLDGVPRGGFLSVEVGRGPYYNFGGEKILWSSGHSEKHAAAALRLLGLALAFPIRRFPYLVATSNSNSASRWLLLHSGVRLPASRRVKLACDPRYAGWLCPAPRLSVAAT
jgi:hypothetical protein